MPLSYSGMQPDGPTWRRSLIVIDDGTTGVRFA
jgi:hypothetical protein